MNLLPDKCPKCGATLAAGLCRQCLLLTGMESSPASAGARWTPPTPEELEAQLPKYRVLEMIGRGGMGVVYKGWQTSLERDVAIKVLPPSLTEDGSPFIARFKQEAKTMARLSHPAIVSVYDFDETLGGLCYIVMEFIEGTDVQRMVASQGKLPPEHALAIAMHVCDALAYAHEHGIIHRDIKPANVMVDAQGRVKVTDFGLAKAIHADAALLTGTNLTMGTPGYVAPEALIVGMGVDARADLYAVGVMLYAMLTGKVPQGRFDAASERVPGLDPRFDDIVNRAMQDNRDSRYASAAELGADLSALLTRPVDRASAQTVEAEPALATGGAPPAGGQSSSVRRSARPPAVLLGLAVCAMALFVWKPWSHPGRTPVAVPRALPADQDAEAKAFQKATPPANARLLASATSPAPEAAATPTTPAPAPHPSVSPTPIPSTPAPAETAKPLTVVEKWFAELDAPREEEFRKQVLKPFDTGVASLRARYLAALDAGIARASAANQLADALAWRTERRAFENAQTVAADDANTPAGVQALRADFRQQLTKLGEDRMSRARALLAAYDAILAQNQALLTTRARLDDALLLQNKRDEIARAWLDRPEVIVIPAPLLLASTSQPFVNSLKMEFVPVPITGGPTSGQRVLFSIWDTRVQDYDVFVQETKRQNYRWGTPDFEQGPTHPAVTVSWEDAQLFCQWLTARDQAAGRLPAGFSYRLPSDHEWSCAVELGAKEDAARLPFEKSGQIGDMFPWGSQWPPPAGAGNYAGEELQPALTAGKYIYAKGVIAGYNDGFVNTSPVGSFAANRFGLFDMGGNVLQWCEDWFDTEQKTRVLRGSAWNYYLRSALLSATRAHFAPGYRFHYYGFRCVLAPTAAAPAAAAAPILAGKGAGAPGTFLPGQSVDLLALPGLAGLDLGFAPKAHATVIHKEAGRLRIKGDKYSGTIYAPLAVPGGEYELAVGVGKEFGACVLMRIPLPKSHVVVVFNRSGQVGLFSNQNKADLIPAGSAWPAGRPITLRLRVKFGAVGVADELEAKVGAYPSAIWRGRLADYQFDGNLSEGRLGLTIAPDVKTIESFTLRMIQGEATLLPPGVKLLPSSAPSSSPSPEKHGTNVVAAAPATPRPVMGAGAPIDLKFTAIDGRKVDLETLRGKVVLVDFWASWCQPCMLEIPHVVEAYHRFHDQGFEVVGISFDEDKAALQRITQEKGMTWPQYFDGKVWQNDYAVKYGIHSVPTMWLIDKQGRVATTKGREDLAGQVEKLLGGEAR